MLNRLHSQDPDWSNLPSASNAAGLRFTELDDIVSGIPLMLFYSYIRLNLLPAFALDF